LITSLLGGAPSNDAVIDSLGPAGRRHRPRPAAAPRLGTQYRSAHFAGSLACLGMSDDLAFLGEPETNGCAERWIQLYDTIGDLLQAVAGFVDRYSAWLIQRHA
jgi:transposase InsO family protein